MLHRFIVITAIFVLSAFSAHASQIHQYRGILHRGADGATLELFRSGERIPLSGLDASIANRHNGQAATVEGELAFPTGENEPPVLYVDRITVTVTAPRIRHESEYRPRENEYRPPETAGERAADTLINVVPSLFAF